MLLGLLVLHGATLYLRLVKRYDVTTFDLNFERNFPTYYQMVVLWVSAYLIGLIASGVKAEAGRYFSLWVVLSGIFVFPGIDEGFTVHEWVNKRMATNHDFGEARFFAWVIPYAVLVVCFAIPYLVFLFHLPLRYRGFFLASAVLFVGGALGMELISVNRALDAGIDDIGYELLATVEEMLEFTGIALFSYSLCDYLLYRYPERLYRFFRLQFRMVA